MMKDETNCEDDFSYRAQECLFKRWRDGIDLEPLIALLESKTTDERLTAAYYLGEAVPRGDLRQSAMHLADDRLSYCRRVFVGYMTNSGLYSEAIAVALAKGLFDFDINVRIETINWAVYTSDDRFADFSRLVASGAGVRDTEYWRESELKRALRGLSIARRLRDSESVEEIRKETPEEDSYTFDYFQVFEKRVNRYIERRKVGASLASASVSEGYDDYEIGVLGEQYDNLGKLKSYLP
jgi:hypothetical protein